MNNRLWQHMMEEKYFKQKKPSVFSLKLIAKFSSDEEIHIILREMLKAHGRALILRKGKKEARKISAMYLTHGLNAMYWLFFHGSKNSKQDFRKNAEYVFSKFLHELNTVKEENIKPVDDQD